LTKEQRASEVQPFVPTSEKQSTDNVQSQIAEEHSDEMSGK